jgi:hypothetical protein
VGDLLGAVRACVIPENQVLAGREMPDLSSLVATCIEYGLDPERLVGLDWLDTLIRCKAFLRQSILDREDAQRKHWTEGTARNRELQAGDRVSYTFDFLTSVGSCPGGEYDRCGRVVEVLRDYLPGKDALTIAWDDGTEGVTAIGTVALVNSHLTTADSSTWHRDRQKLAHLDGRAR